MRICILTKFTLVHGIGGMQIHTDLLARSLAKAGHDITIITTAHFEGKEVENKNGIVTYFLRHTRPGIFSSLWWRESRNFFRYLHQRTPFDIIISEGYSANSLHRLLKRWKLPCIVFTHGFMPEHIINEYHQIDGVITFIKYFSIKVPEVFYYTLFYELPMIYWADATACVSKRIAKLAHQFYFISKEKLSVIYNWIDEKMFKPDQLKRHYAREQFGAQDNTFIFLMAAVISKQKGFHIGVKAFVNCLSQCPNAEMWIVGEGAFLLQLKEIIKKLRIEQRIKFLGLQPPEMMPTIYNAADCFLMPTLRLEGLSYTVIEALTCGLPTIATRLGGNPEVIGESGILVKPSNIDELTNAMISIYQNAQLREHYRITARARAEKLFSEKVGIDAVLKLIEKLINDYLAISQRLVK